MSTGSLLDISMVGAEEDELGGDDPGLHSAIPRTEGERTTRRGIWWSSICVGRSPSTAATMAVALGLGALGEKIQRDGESEGVS